jgi:hypothetical protein
MTTVLLALLGAGGLALGVAEIPTEGVGFLVVASPSLLIAAALVYLLRARRRGRGSLAVAAVADLGERGVVLPYSAALGCGCAVAGVYCLLFSGLIAIGGWADGSVVGLSLFVAALLACTYLLWCVVDLARGRLRRGFVALTPSGIYHRSWARRSYLPWTDVLEVVSEDREPLVRVVGIANTTGWDRRTSSTWPQEELNTAPHLVVPGRFLAVHPELLYRAIRFYLDNPAARPELADDAALTRIGNL